MRSWILSFFIISFSSFILCGCATKIIPTDTCKYQIEASDMGLKNGIDAIDFFDMAIEVAKEHHFPPPMKYDKNLGLLVFGHEDISTMPGRKIVVYMWVPNEDLMATNKICFNTLQLETKEGLITENMAAEIVSDYIDDLKTRYREKVENTERLMKKYNL